MNTRPSIEPFDLQEDVVALSLQFDRLDDVLALPVEKLVSTAPSISSWSAGAHAYHMVLACDLSLRNASALAKDTGRLVRTPEDRNEEAQAILRAGAIPRGVAEAPRFVTPPPKLDFDLVRQILGEVRAAHAALVEDSDALRRAPRTIPHQLLGDLTGPEWVRFARVHTDHHLVIVDEVLSALS